MITVQLEATDLAVAYKLHKRWGLKWWALFCLYCGPFVGFGIWLMVSSPIFARWGIVILAYVGLLCIFIGYGKLVLTPKIARKNFRRQAELQRPYTLSWNEDTFTKESPTGISHTPWSDFMKWSENEDLFLVYFTRASFRIVPKRFFNETSTVSEFRRFLNEKIGPAA